ncbi:MAG TPA: hypothetical protein VF646_03230, partial [Cytophagales bacterium]
MVGEGTVSRPDENKEKKDGRPPDCPFLTPSCPAATADLFQLWGIKVQHQQNLRKMEKQHNVVEYRLEASAFQWEIAPGKAIPAWGFNGQVPGP